MSNIKKFISFLTGKDYLMHKPALDYLAVNTEQHRVTGEWHEHQVIQFDSIKSWEDWSADNLSKNERRFWILYKRLKSQTGEVQL